MQNAKRTIVLIALTASTVLATVLNPVAASADSKWNRMAYHQTTLVP